MWCLMGLPLSISSFLDRPGPLPTPWLALGTAELSMSPGCTFVVPRAAGTAPSGPVGDRRTFRPDFVRGNHCVSGLAGIPPFGLAHSPPWCRLRLDLSRHLLPLASQRTNGRDIELQRTRIATAPPPTLILIVGWRENAQKSFRKGPRRNSQIEPRASRHPADKAG